MSRPNHVKLFVCRFRDKSVGNNNAFDFCREITPIIAQDTSHAIALVWKQHGEYLTQFYGTPLEWGPFPRYKKMSERTRKFLERTLEIEELDAPRLWCKGFFISPHLRTLIG